MSKSAAKLTSRQIIAALCHANGLPKPTFEFYFHPTRKWRFDCALVDAKIAIEVEGGAFTEGRHTRGAGYVNDLKKYNEATIYGWRLLRYTPQQIKNGAWAEDVKVALGVSGSSRASTPAEKSGSVAGRASPTAETGKV